LPAAAQKRLLEEGGAMVDVTGVRCLGCTRAYNRIARAKAAYERALRAAADERTAAAYLAAARAALALVRAGGRARIDEAIANARRAERGGSQAATTVIATLRALRRAQR
jgi:hypothetical protein